MTSEPAAGCTDTSLKGVQDAIVAEMAGLDDPLAKYEYLVRIGRELRVRAAHVRQDAFLVPGCQSRTWIRVERRNGRVHIEADSDAMITRGIVALLLRVLDGRTPGEIAQAELFFLDRTGLRTHLSPARANGLGAMVTLLRKHAHEALEAGA